MGVTKNQIVKLHLAREQKSSETIDVLKELLADAEAGELTGIAYAVTYQGRRYSLGATGVAKQSPTFTLGMLQVLNIRLAQSV